MREFIDIVESAGEARLVEGPWIDGRCVPRLPDGSPPQHLYRIMSKAEYETGEFNGRFMSRDGRVHADVRPHFEYCEPGSGNVLVRIDYRDEDGWKAKFSSLGVVAITDIPIPAERVHLISNGTRQDIERAPLSESLNLTIPEKFQAMIRDGHIEVWRAIKAGLGFTNDLFPGDGLGRCWAYEEQAAIAYDGGRGGQTYRLHGLMPVSSIDWRETISLDGSDEREIRAKHGAPFILLDIDLVNQHGDVLEADVKPSLHGATMTTGTWV